MPIIAPAQAAAWLQLRIDHDDTAFRRRSGAGEALKRLREASEALVHRVGGDHVDLLLGRRIGGATLSAARDRYAVQAFVDGFYREHGALFSAAAPAAGALRVERVRPGSPTVAEVQQYVDAIPVADARWTLVFDRAGHLTQVTGAPFDPARLTAARRPPISAEEAVRLAKTAVSDDDVEATATLAIEGRTDRLVWTVELKGITRPSLFGAVEVDAHQRTVSVRKDRCEHGLIAIPVKHYSHPSGIKDSSASTITSDINVDSAVTTPPKPNLPSFEFFSLQRIGSGRARIWNASGDGSQPIFTRTISDQKSYFTKAPGSTSTKVFNEQQTYFWAQTLKTHVDEWGREPNAYGHHPVDASRAINVDIVVNGDANMEDDWSSDGSTGCMHGYFRSTAPRDWFSGHPSSSSTVPAVFLFNSAGNSASPQFFGPELSSSYSIVAHEVGHFISWQYGSWTGPSGTELARSLNEGHSMVLAALLGKQHFSALSYEESEYVTTGSKTAGEQWSHFVYGQTPLRYSAMDCVGDDAYYIAWPFVQAMWRLMNNKGPDGDPIWGSDAAAIANTADLFMYSLHTFTSDSTMTWDKLSLGLLARLYDRISDGTEQEPLANTYCDVYSVLSQHALLTRCLNSP
jgi:hypothetical protein